MILDDLSEEQWRVVSERYVDFYNENYSEWRKAIDLAINAPDEAVGKDYVYHARWAAYYATNSEAAGWATRELIAMHKILEDYQKPLTFFQMILEVL